MNIENENETVRTSMCAENEPGSNGVNVDTGADVVRSDATAIAPCDGSSTEVLEDVSIPVDPALDEQNDDSSDEPDDPDRLISAEEREYDVDRIEQLIAEKNYAALRSELPLMPALNLCELFYEIDSTHHPLVFRLLPKELAAEVFVELDPETRRALIEGFSDKELASVLEELYIDDTVDIIEEMPAAVVKRILRTSAKEDRAIINTLLRYPKDSAGSMMTTEYVRFVPTMTVNEALAHIRKVAIDKETIYTCYVTDTQRHLVGIVTAKALLISDGETTLDSIMEDNVIFASTTDDREEVAHLFDKYGFIALPVVDSEQRLVGIVTVDDALDVIHEETEEDFAKMAGITPTETSYSRTSVFALWRARIPWLLLLMVSATFSSTILNRFEAALPTVLILFVPMLMDTGGNSGGQTSVTVIRALSFGEITYKDLLRVLWKEIRVGLCAGLTIGVVAFGKVMLVDRLIMGNDDVTAIIALIVGITLAITITVSKAIGATLPILAKRIGFDPAVMASPFITTIVDAASLMIYFAVAYFGFGLSV